MILKKVFGKAKMNTFKDWARLSVLENDNQISYGTGIKSLDGTSKSYKFPEINSHGTDFSTNKQMQLKIKKGDTRFAYQLLKESIRSLKSIHLPMTKDEKEVQRKTMAKNMILPNDGVMGSRNQELTEYTPSHNGTITSTFMGSK